MANSIKYLMSAAIIGASSIAAVPAGAAVLVCGGANCFGPVQNVLVNAGSGSTVTGSVGLHEVIFSSTTDATLVGEANGQAKIGSSDNLLNNISFRLNDGFGFQGAVFNLSPLPGNQANEATSIFLNYTLSDGTSSSIPYSIATNGNNWLGIYGTAGEIFTSAGFTANPSTTGVGDIRQVRLGEISAIPGAVPEPATWALMLLGFGVVGGAMRSRKNAVKINYAA